MRKQFVITLLLLFLSIMFGFSQKWDVPQNVENAFNKKYPKYHEATWETKEQTYEVTFNLSDIYYLAVFEAGGNWIQTTKTIPTNLLPINLKKIIDKKYPSGSIFNVNFVENNKKERYYEVAIETQEEANLIQIKETGDIIKTLSRKLKSK